MSVIETFNPPEGVAVNEAIGAKLIRFASGVGTVITAVELSGKTMEPEDMTPLIIIALVTVTESRFELIIVDPVPSAVTFESVEPETTVLKRVLLVEVELVKFPPKINELFDIAPESEALKIDPPVIEELLTVELKTEMDESELPVIVLKLTVEEAIVEDETVLPVTLDAPVMPKAVDEAMLGEKDPKNMPFMVELSTKTLESEIRNGPT